MPPILSTVHIDLQNFLFQLIKFFGGIFGIFIAPILTISFVCDVKEAWNSAIEEEKNKIIIFIVKFSWNKIKSIFGK